MDSASLKLAELQKICSGDPGTGKTSRGKKETWLSGSEFDRRRFRDIDGLLTADTVDLIYAGPKPALSLPNLTGRIAVVDRFRFWKRIFDLRGHIPEEVVFHFWYECLTDPCKTYSPTPFFQLVERLNGRECPDPKSPENLPPADELLIDNPAVRARYCRERKPGWEMLQCLSPVRTEPPNLPEGMRRAIEDDSVETFMIFRDMAGVRPSYGLLEELIRKKAVKIFVALLKEGRIFNRSVTPEKLCARCAARYEDALSVPFLEIVEEHLPGTVKNVRDPWGRNLLWYAAANRRTAFFHPFCRLTPFLLECGCDPENENQLGISWRTMLNRLSYYQKSCLLEERQQENRAGGISPLERDQPLYALADRSHWIQWLKELSPKR